MIETLLPVHIVGEAGVAVTVGDGLTVTVIVVVSEHVPVAPITEYVCVEDGDAVTDDPVVALRPVAGLHV